MYSFADFVGVYSGQYIKDDGSLGPNPYGAQCVNLPNLWCENLGIEQFPGNAGSFEYDSHPDCDWVGNSPANAPPPGAVVVWEANSNAGLPFGHVGICISANVNNFTSFDQNWPLNSPAHSQWHNYNDIAGWLVPRKARWGSFSGVVDVSVANVRSGPGTSYGRLRSVGKGTALTFTGYVHTGTPIPDAITGAGDDRWFAISAAAGHGWIASALVDGNPSF